VGEEQANSLSDVSETRGKRIAIPEKVVAKRGETNMTKEIIKRDDILAIAPLDVKKKLEAISQFQAVVQKELHEGVDYGIIPGTQKPTLLKPGAEKIAKLLNLSDDYEIIEKVEDWEKPFFYYMIKCFLREMATGTLVSVGLGSCNSKETKYRWREAKRKCPACGNETIYEAKDKTKFFCWEKKGGCGRQFNHDDPGILDQEVGRVENTEIYSIVNTLLKMAKKRAEIDANLSAGRLSNLFTQDLEDFLPDVQEPIEVKPIPLKQAEEPKEEAKKTEPNSKAEQKTEGKREEAKPDNKIPKVEPKKVEPKKVEPRPQADTTPAKAHMEIEAAITELVNKYGRDPKKLMVDIIGRLQKKFGIQEATVPRDLNKEQSNWLLSLLKVSLEKAEAQIAEQAAMDEIGQENEG
jgi:hypothetical protein